MLDTLTRYLQGIHSPKDAYLLSRVLSPIADRLSSMPLTTAGLIIGTTDPSTAKIGASAFLACVGGRQVTLNAGTEMVKPLGMSMVTGQVAICCFFVDAAGVTTAVWGTPGTSAGTAAFPQFPPGKTLIGFATVTSGATYTGGTTALTGIATYNSPVGPFDPTILL